MGRLDLLSVARFVRRDYVCGRDDVFSSQFSASTDAMKTLTKHTLAAMVTGMPTVKAVDLIETLMDLIICYFQNGGERVVLRGFGTFKIRRRRAFTGSDPRNGDPIDVPAALSISFKPGVEAIRRLNLK